MPESIIAFFAGNQVGKTASIVHQYVLRLFCWHPIPKKNVFYFECPRRTLDNPAPHGYLKIRYDDVVLPYYEAGTYNIKNVPKDGKCPYCGEKLKIHYRTSRVIRMCSENLPGDRAEVSKDGTQTAETKNTIYPALKMWLPKFLIKRDIRFRSFALIARDPWDGNEFFGEIYRGDDIVFDFVSYSQQVQSSAGVQRMSIYFDEEPPKDFYDEQIPRLFKEDGDIIIGLTPAEHLTWTYDEIYERARVYYRTQRVCDFMNKQDKLLDIKPIMTTENDTSIGVVQAASDDNETLSKDVLERMFENISDPDEIAIRRYGIHKQISGRIFKSFDYRVHYINFNEYFPDGMFHDWYHYRMIDYHTHNRWAVVWMSLSPQNEAFVWREYAPDPEKMTTWLIANEIAHMSEDYRFRFNIVDPLAKTTQSNTTTTVVDDLNEYFMMLRKEGIGTGGFWEAWDTKGTRGREVIKERLSNSLRARKPFNNKIDGTYKPTLWICNTCPETARSLKMWRYEEWANRKDRISREKKEKPMQKFSHFCMCLEGAFKDNRCRPPLMKIPTRHEAPRYFQGARRATL